MIAARTTRARRLARHLAVAALAVGATACGGRGAAQPAPVPAVNMLTEAERRAGWTLLFDGRTLDGWRAYNGTGPAAGWAVEDGALALVQPRGASDIVTTKAYANFELALEWRVKPDGPPANSGIFIRAEEKAGEPIYFSAPEMQVLDDARHPDGRSPLTSAGAAYGLYPAIPGVVRRPGEWNAVRIVVRGNAVEQWMNGTRIASYELGSAEWTGRVRASKFGQWPRYGRARAGLIGLQEHGSWVAFRNVKLRVLP